MEAYGCTLSRRPGLWCCSGVCVEAGAAGRYLLCAFSLYLTLECGEKLMRVNRCAALDASMWPMQLPDLVKESATARCGRAGRVHGLIPCDPVSGRVSGEEVSSFGHI